ncbi:MAG: hypothetical protein WA979_13505 [Pacificimonas sp.]
MTGFFQGNFVGGVDSKGRMSVPASFRDAVQTRSGNSRIVLMPHREMLPCLVGYEPTEIIALNDAIKLEHAADDVTAAADQRRRRAFSLSQEIGYEETGRIVMPEDFRDYAEIEKEVLFAGHGDSFQIWNPDLYLEHVDDPLATRMIGRKLQRMRTK